MQNETNQNQQLSSTQKISTVLAKNKMLLSASVLLFALAFFLRAWRLSSAPDIFGDEVLYVDIAVGLPKYGQLMAFGSPWFVHPPLFYMMQSVFFQLSGITSASLSNVFTARVTSAVYSALTVSAVFVWMTKISDYRIGAITAFALIFEPYALKYARIGILESMVLLFVVIALFLFARAQYANKNYSLKNFALGGVFFGLALLVKEVAVYLLVILAVWVLITQLVNKSKINVKGIAVFIATGLVMYSGYVLWALSVDASDFLGTNRYLIERAFWAIRDTGYTAPTALVPFFTDFTGHIDLYIMTYIAIAIAIVASYYLVTKEKSQVSTILVSWFAGSAIFFASIGTHNPQFLIYVTVPAVIITGYALSKLAFGISTRKLLSAAALILVFAIAVYNAGVWVTVDGVGTDNATSQSVKWIQANVPNGDKVWTDYIFQYMDSNQQIVGMQSYLTLDSIKGQGIHYFIFSPRWGTTPDLAIEDYAMQQGQLVAVFHSESLQWVDVYYVANPI